MEGKTDNSLIILVSHREIFGFKTVLVTVVGVQVDRDEMNGCADISCLHFLNKAGPVDGQAFEIEPDNIQVPCRFNLRPLAGKLKFREVPESCIVGPDYLKPPGLKGGELLQLMQAQ